MYLGAKVIVASAPFYYGVSKRCSESFGCYGRRPAGWTGALFAMERPHPPQRRGFLDIIAVFASVPLS